LDAIERGALHLSSLCLLRGHLRTENVEELVERCAGKSARDVAELLAARAPRPDVPATIAPTSSQAIFSPPPATPTSEPARIAPLAKERFEMRVTISRELRDKLQRARDLMRHANPKDDLERVLDAAIDALVAKLEKRRLAKTERPQAKTRGSLAGRVAAAVRRAVFDRDGTRCTYVGANGKRCTSCTWLEIDHILPRADGGSDELRNLRVRCRAHNRLWAEERFGKQHVERSIALRRRSWDRDGADLALRGLVLLGFPKRDASSAIAKVAETHSCDEQPLPKEEIVREALRWLT
ncbi:MAG TPA: HNH endonuclease, partial [Labilithrix sp.]